MVRSDLCRWRRLTVTIVVLTVAVCIPVISLSATPVEPSWNLPLPGTALPGLAISGIDVSNPARPRYVSQLEFDAYFYDMTRSGNHILLTLPSIPGGGVRSIDVSDPGQPRIDGQYVPDSAFAFGLAVVPGGVVALGSSLGLDVLRVGIAEN